MRKARESVVVALVLVVAACGGPVLPSPSLPPTATPTGSSQPTVTPSPAPTSTPSLAWTEIALDPAVFAGAQVGTVVAGGPGLVAFGRVGDVGAPVTWTSTDGERWTRHDQQAWTLGGGVPTSVASGPEGLVALGWGWGQDQQVQEPWLSPDGITWTRSPSPARELGQGLDGIIGTSGAIVAYGSQRADGSSVLTSEDGRSWAPLPDPEGSLGPRAAVASVVAWHGGLLATGTIAGVEGVVWTSADGRTWRLLPRQAALAEDEMGNGYFGGRLFRLRDGYLLVGVRNTLGDAMAAWRSDDGTSWTVALQEDPYAEGNVAAPDAALLGLREVTVLPDANVGAVQACDENGACRESLAVSLDGLHWTPTAPSAAAGSPFHRIVAVGSRALLFGIDSAGRVQAWWGAPTGASPAGAASPRPSATTSPQPSPAASPTPAPVPPAAAAAELGWQRLGGRGSLFGGTGSPSIVVAVAPYRDGILAVGTTPWDIPGFGGYSPPFTTITWRSGDGITWQRSPRQKALEDGRAHAIATRGRIAVAVGSSDTGVDGETTIGISWRTTDGLHWTRSPSQASLRDAWMEDIVATDDGFLAVGAISGYDTSSDMGTTKPMAWTSADGLRWTRAPAVEAQVDTWNDNMVECGMQSMARGGPGYVAVGWGTQHGIVWTSEDGTTWKIISQAALGATWFGSGGELVDVLAGPAGLVAVGSSGGAFGTAQGVIFTSPDGLQWERMAVPVEIARSHLTSIATFAGGLVIGGGVSAGNSGDIRPVLFTSPDGRAWTEADRPAFAGTTDAPLDGDSSRLVTDVTAFGDQIVAVGFDAGRGAVWLGGLPDTLYPSRACPTGSVDLAVLNAMTDLDRVACFAGDTLRFRVFVKMEQAESGPWAAILSRPGGAYAEFWIRRPGECTLPGCSTLWTAGWHEVTGHFGDPSCDAAAKPLAGEFPYAPPNQAVLTCQASFWVTKVRPAR